MKRAFQDIASALCYSIIRGHFQQSAGDPGPAWNATVRFVLDQHARMPDYLRLPLMILTLIFDFSGYLVQRQLFHNLDPDLRWNRIVKARNSLFGPFRDLIRYYESLTIFGFHDELARTGLVFGAPGESAAAAVGCPNITARHDGRAQNEPPVTMRSEIVVIGSGPGGAITACLLAEAGREVTLIESGPFLSHEECPQFTRAEMEWKYRNGGVTAALGRTKVAYVEGHCVGGGSEINAGLYHRTPDEMLDRWRREYLLEGAGSADMLAHFEACERDVSVSYMPGVLPSASLKLHEGAQIKGWESLEVPRWFKYDAAALDGIKQTMGQTFIPRALRAGCQLVPNIAARHLSRRGSEWVVKADRTKCGKKVAGHELFCESLFVCGGAIQTPALLLASGLVRNAGRSLRMHPTVKVVARFPETINSRDMGVPVHQVKEFSPRLSFGCSISSAPYLSLGMLDHPSRINESAGDWQRMAAYYVMTTGGGGSVRKLPGYRDPLVSYALTDKDMRDLADGLRKLCEILFAAGATTLYPTVAGLAPLCGADDLTRIPGCLPHGRTNLMTVHLFSSCPMGEDRSLCVADSFGRVHGLTNLYVADASLLCTAPGVNPQGSVMAFARRNAMHFLDRRQA